ncbi:MAG: hypothetical protein LBP53_01965 [Candidatus Peribacteria bacterium]|jgi:FSR family fosmidomycin resistance protein-like MFS transporter|nr:hypothetical protein [Candidatus Peribacteria bacterium]
MFALLGLTFNLLALFMLLFSPLFAVIITGLGNALFHVGGGSIALQLGHKKATLPGIFVSTGAMGIFLGTFLPVNVPFSPLWLSILAIVTMSWI